MHIGILQVDSVSPPYREAHGDYPGMFEQLLAGAAAGAPLEVSNYAVLDGVLPSGVDACDGYLITGSRESVYDDLPWLPGLVSFVGEALDAGVPVVGICFGHQLLAHFFGGEVGPAEVGWGVGVHTTTVERTAPWMEPPLESIGLLCSHKDQVKRLPEGARLFAASDFCPLAGFEIEGRALTFQGHPEFSRGYAEDLMDARVDLLGEATYRAGKASLTHATDEVTVAHWILNFVRGARAG